MKKKIRIARLSIISNTFLIIMKIFIGLLSGSVSIISEAIHSSVDLLASIIAFFSVSVSDSAPDERHPYGHGKFENISGVIEAFLIIVAAFWIIYNAIRKLTGIVKVESLGWAILVMFISAIINLIVSASIYKVSKETESVALEADAFHLRTDVYTSAGVGIGLFLIWLTGYYKLDPVVAIIVALFILKESYKLMKKAFSPLLDSSLNPEELEEIIAVLNEMKVEYHDLKSRKGGNYKFIDFHMTLPSCLTLDKVHEYCDEIEEKLKININQLTVNIHVEPESENKK